MQTLRIGVVGVGHLGQHHARNYSEMEGCRLVGVADIDRKTATRVAGQVRTQAFFDHKLLLGEIDAVSVVVPTIAHYEVAREFLEAGVHVIIEKPIASSVEEARTLVSFLVFPGLITMSVIRLRSPTT